MLQNRKLSFIVCKAYQVNIVYQVNITYQVNIAYQVKL